MDDCTLFSFSGAPCARVPRGHGARREQQQQQGQQPQPQPQQRKPQRQQICLLLRARASARGSAGGVGRTVSFDCGTDIRCDGKSGISAAVSNAGGGILLVSSIENCPAGGRGR